MKLRDARLLLVTDPAPRTLPKLVAAAVRGGADVVQLRDKHSLLFQELLPLAEELSERCAGAEEPSSP